MVISNATQPVTISVGNLPVGSQFQVVQASTGQVTIAGTGGVTVVPPFEGTLQLAGQNAAVTVVKATSTKAFVFGYTTKP